MGHSGLRVNNCIACGSQVIFRVHRYGTPSLRELSRYVLATAGSMSALVSYPTGNAHLRAVLRGLGGSGALEELWATLCLPPCLARAAVLPETIRRRLLKRCFTEAPWSRTEFETPDRDVAQQLELGRHATPDEIIKRIKSDLEARLDFGLSTSAALCSPLAGAEAIYARYGDDDERAR